VAVVRQKELKLGLRTKRAAKVQWPLQTIESGNMERTSADYRLEGAAAAANQCNQCRKKRIGAGDIPAVLDPITAKHRYAENRFERYT
jgi:hypothetical protein